ncbi:hypothetical protein [Serratia phage vB_SmaM_Hera]|uniref:Uncharacterized protein n=1 Tax=Serratia phage vB_SmaM_Hera TaxID=2777369 RepID=A0A7T3N9D1_9CAUD|nr:hypothetical protein [Serratia phage vB_SmaM_Hera]
MPLSTGTSNKAREENVEREIAAGKKPKQAVAIAYAQQRKNEGKAEDSDEVVVLLSKLLKLLQKVKDTRL